MKIIIMGYGRMGHMVEEALKQRGHEVACTIDNFSPADAKSFSPEMAKNADALIEFSLPEGIMDRIESYMSAGIPAIVGTTGWNQHLEKAKKVVSEKNGTLMLGSNFSIGAHLFFQLVGRAASLIDDIVDYDVMLTEYHHKMKKDSPSGTALTAAEYVLSNLARKNTIVPDKLDRAIADNEMHVASVRGGNIPGTHIMTMDSAFDSIEIKHTARNRQGFALGSVLAAEWLKDRKGFHPVEDFIKDFFQGE